MRDMHEEQDCCAGARVGPFGPGAFGCCGMPRRFPTARERRKALEDYRDQLKNELEGVEERIGRLETK